jgi:hypothetical protein
MRSGLGVHRMKVQCPRMRSVRPFSHAQREIRSVWLDASAAIDQP